MVVFIFSTLVAASGALGAWAAVKVLRLNRHLNSALHDLDLQDQEMQEQDAEMDALEADLAAAALELESMNKGLAKAKRNLADEKANRNSYVHNRTIEIRNRMEMAINKAYQAEKAMEMVRLYAQQGMVPGCTPEGIEDCVEVSKRLSVANEAIAVASD